MRTSDSNSPAGDWRPHHLPNAVDHSERNASDGVGRLLATGAECRPANTGCSECGRRKSGGREQENEHAPWITAADEGAERYPGNGSDGCRDRAGGGSEGIGRDEVASRDDVRERGR